MLLKGIGLSPEIDVDQRTSKKFLQHKQRSSDVVPKRLSVAALPRSLDMPMDERAEYYESRCRAAVAMSQAAAAPAIQMIHLDLARRYAELVDASDRDRDMASIMPNPMRTA